jgi:hypothetical protein
VRSTNSMEVLEWQALSVQHLVCPSKQRIDVECTGIHTAFIVPHTIGPLCKSPSDCPSFCAATSIPFPENTTIIAGDVYSHPSSPSSSPYPSLFAAVFDCPEGIHTLAGLLLFHIASIIFTFLTVLYISVYSRQSSWSYSVLYSPSD